MNTKICVECKIELLLDDFYLHRKTGYYSSRCKKCHNERSKSWNRGNKDKVSQISKRSYSKNIDARRAYMREAHKTPEARAKRNEQRRKRYAEDKSYSLLDNVRKRINHALKHDATIKSTRTLDYLGCSITELKAYLEALFLVGMSWENREAWHIDHIIPCCAFVLTKEENRYICFNYTNLRPLWKQDNLAKLVEDKKLIKIF